MADLRDGFREITSGWMLRDDAADLTARMVRLVQWCERNKPLTPDEKATLKFMLEALFVREMREGVLFGEATR
jgi:hypothetical protein